MTITKRSVKGSALTYAELDENFRHLEEESTLDNIISNDFTKSAGTVVQVKHGGTGGVMAFKVSSSTPDDSAYSGIAVTITPKYANSEIYIDFAVTMGTTSYQTKLFLIRSIGGVETRIGAGDEYNGRSRATASVHPYDDNSTTAGYLTAVLANHIVDRPNTTEPVTYFLKMAGYNGTTVYLNRSANWQNGGAGGYDAVPSSNMKVMEVTTDNTAVSSLTYVADAFVEMPASAGTTRQITIPSTAQEGDIAVLWTFSDSAIISSVSDIASVIFPSGWSLAVGHNDRENTPPTFSYVQSNSFVKILNANEPGSTLTLTNQQSTYTSLAIVVFRPDIAIDNFYTKNGMTYNSSTTISHTVDTTNVIPVSVFVVGLGGRYSGQNPILAGTDITINASTGTVGDPKYGYKIHNSGAITSQTVTSTDAGRQSINAFYLEVV